MKHEVGKDIVAATTFILGAVKKVGTEVADIAKTGLKGADLDDAVVKKLDEVAQESLDLISASVDEVAGKSINKFLKENDVKGNFMEYEGPTINSAKLQKGDKLNSTEVQNILNLEKTFVGPGDLDDILTSSTNLPDGTIAISKGQKGGWSKELNKPKPNKKYKVGKNEYTIDGDGRVTNAKGELDLKTSDRNGYQQRKSVTSKDGNLDTDQGGHLIASIFDGAGEQINIVPMLGNLNQGAWRSMEATWQSALQAGKKVEVDIKVIYEGASKRPLGFQVDSWVNGIKQPQKIFDN